MRRTGIRTRLARLEKRLAKRRPFPAVFMSVYPDANPGPLLGYEGNGVRVMAEPGEALGELQARAATATGARFLCALYGPETAAPAPVAAPRTPPAMWKPEPGPDPFALAGIGRRASRAELERMGALWVPPERLI